MLFRSDSAGLGGGFSNLADFLSMIIRLKQQQGQFDDTQAQDTTQFDAEFGQSETQFDASQALAEAETESRDQDRVARGNALQTTADAQARNAQSLQMNRRNIGGSFDALEQFDTQGIPTPQSTGLDALSGQSIPTGGLDVQLPSFEEAAAEQRQTERNRALGAARVETGKTGQPSQIGQTGLETLPFSQAGSSNSRSLNLRGREADLRAATLRVTAIDKAVTQFRQFDSNGNLGRELGNILNSGATRDEMKRQARDAAGGLLESLLTEVNTSLQGIADPVDIVDFMTRIATGGSVDVSPQTEQQLLAAYDLYVSASEDFGTDPMTFEEFRALEMGSN